MQQNIRCIAAATFKMMAIGSARSASVPSEVKPKLTSDSGTTYPASCELSPYVISRPLQAHPAKLPIDSTVVGTDLGCPHIWHQV